MITNHKFFDHEIEQVQITATTVELDLKDGLSAVLLNEADVIALAKHFGLVVGKPIEGIKTPAMSDKSTCIHCGAEIEYVGPYWRHTGVQPRHIAEPKK